MTQTRLTSRQVLRLATACAVIAGTSIGLGATTATASSNGIFLACGYAEPQTIVSGSGCTDLPTALSDALTLSNQTASSTTVELMPGTYCPITLPNDSRNLTIVGVGAAGLADPSTFTGDEAALSTFGFDPTACADSAGSTYDVQTPDHGSQLLGNMTLENLAVSGASNGPTNGIHIVDAGVRLRDVLVEEFASGTGFTYSNSFSEGSIDVENSAFVVNQTGLNVIDEGSIDDTLIAGNTVGLTLAGDLHLDNDTISRNSEGLDVNSNGSSVQLANTIIGDNTTVSCSGATGDLEPGGESDGSGNNLLSSSCNNFNDDTDIPIGSTTINDVADNGGATPSILPPSVAVDAGDPGFCNATGSDQREFVSMSPGGCDIGSVNTTNSTGVADPQSSGSPVAFGAVPINQQGYASVTIQNGLASRGGGLIGIAGVALSPTNDFSLAADGCTFELLVNQQSQSSCSIGIIANPSGIGSTQATLTVTTTAGIVHVPVTATGDAAFPAPTAVMGAAGDKSVNLTWTGPTTDQIIDGYDVQYSADNGATWSEPIGTSLTTPSATISHLKDATSYLFEVAAIDIFGDGPWSTPSAAVTPHRPPVASALTPPKATTINEGASITLTTTLTNTVTGKPVANAPVLLVVGDTPNSTGPALQVTTNSRGVATSKQSPDQSVSYKWTYAGSSSLAPSSTPKAVVSVAQVVRAKLSPAKVKHGKPAEVYGTVSPTEKGKTVGLQQFSAGKWKRLSTTATIKKQKLPDHTTAVGFVIHLATKHKGRQKLRVTRAATAANVAGVSPPLTVTVT